MVLLLRSITGRVGLEKSPMLAMLTGMMPLVESRIGGMDPANIITMATLLRDSFIRVADPNFTLEEMEQWTRPSETA